MIGSTAVLPVPTALRCQDEPRRRECSVVTSCLALRPDWPRTPPERVQRCHKLPCAAPRLATNPAGESTALSQVALRCAPTGHEPRRRECSVVTSCLALRPDWPRTPPERVQRCHKLPCAAPRLATNPAGESAALSQVALRCAPTGHEPCRRECSVVTSCLALRSD